MRALFLVIVSLLFAACSTMSTLPETENVKVSREEPGDDCKSLGKVEGRTMSVKGTAEQALDDLKKEAARKGANYLVVKQYSGQETSVTGVAYNCP